MYFGVLAVGADLAGGLAAMEHIRKSDVNVALIFKDMQAEFLKRAEGDTVFTCVDGDAIQQLVQSSIDSGERMEMPVHIIATVPDRFQDDPVARFRLTLSLKRK